MVLDGCLNAGIGGPRGLYRDNGKENGDYYSILGLYMGNDSSGFKGARFRV